MIKINLGYSRVEVAADARHRERSCGLYDKIYAVDTEDTDFRGKNQDAFSFLACTQKTKSTFQFVLEHKMKTFRHFLFTGF